MLNCETPKCSRCNGRKWIRGLVGGIYECPDCWEFEENQRLFGDYINNNSLNTDKPKRKYVRKEKTKDL